MKQDVSASVEHSNKVFYHFSNAVQNEFLCMMDDISVMPTRSSSEIIGGNWICASRDNELFCSCLCEEKLCQHSVVAYISAGK